MIQTTNPQNVVNQRVKGSSGYSLLHNIENYTDVTSYLSANLSANLTSLLKSDKIVLRPHSINGRDCVVFLDSFVSTGVNNLKFNPVEIVWFGYTTLSLKLSGSVSNVDIYENTPEAPGPCMVRIFLINTNMVLIERTRLYNRRPDFLSFTSSGNSTIHFISSYQDNLTPDLRYSYDKINWIAMTYTTSGGSSTSNIISLTDGQTVYFRGVNGDFSSSDGQYFGNFVFTGHIDAGGNVMSIVHDTEYVYNETRVRMAGLFASNSNLYSPPSLEGGRYLPSCCFMNMFQNCISLTHVADMGYNAKWVVGIKACYGMYYACTSLTTTSALDFSSIGEFGCSYMFYECRSLTVIENFNAESLSTQACGYMFAYCGDLQDTTIPTVKHLSPYCYYRMFAYAGVDQGGMDISRIDDAFGVIETTATGCFNEMFLGSAVVFVPHIPAPTSQSYCQNMFKDCIYLNNSDDILNVMLDIEELAQNCFKGMFNGCSNLIYSPILFAKNLVTGAYDDMFKNCTSLVRIEVLAHDWGNNCAVDWVSGVPQDAGKFFCPSDLTIPSGVNGIPTGWTRVSNG